MINLKKVVRDTLIKIRDDDKVATPRVYGEVFCALAKKEGIYLEECNTINRFIAKCDHNLREKIKISDIHDTESLLELIIRDRKGAKEPKNNKITCASMTLEKCLEILLEALAPSITEKINHELEDIKDELKTNPNIITSEGFREKMAKVIYERIAFDRLELLSYGTDIGTIMDVITKDLKDVIDATGDKEEVFEDILKALKYMNVDKITDIDILAIKNQISDIVLSLKIEMENIKKYLSEKNGEVMELQNKIKSLEEQLERAKFENDIDHLTGVLSKKALEFELRKSEDSYLRYGFEYTILFVDIDHFKNINDKYGHDAGDKVLMAFGDIFKKHLRKTDIIGRFGGEEFLLLLPGTTLKGAIDLANKIKDIIKSSQFLYNKLILKITFSGGVATRYEAQTSEDLIKLADKRLYVAKSSGRDLIVP